MMGKQFQQLEDVLNLPPLDSTEPDESDSMDMMAVLDQARTITSKSKEANGLARHDHEMDELAGMAVTAHKDLMELGMNVELRHAGEILNTASTMLKIAVDAKNNKVEKLLKAMKLELDKRKIDAQISLMDPQEAPIEGTATKLDFNELLKQFKQGGSEHK